MCIICVQVQKDRMTLLEVSRAVKEYKVEEKHVEDLVGVLAKKFGEKAENVVEQICGNTEDDDYDGA